MTNLFNKKSVGRALFGIAVFAVALCTFAGVAAAAPTVQTRSAEVDSGTSVTLNGTLNPDGERTTYWFEYGTNRDVTQSTPERDAGSSDNQVRVSNTISGLSRNRTYYFRLVAENRSGTARGQILSVMTDDNGNDGSSSLEVRTVSARQNGATGAIFQGEVDTDESWSQVWFRYGQNPNSLNESTAMATLFGTGFQSFSRSVSNLIPGATYYYQAAGRDGNDTEYGQVFSFTVSGGTNGNGGFLQVPAVSTDATLSAGINSATVQARVNPNGNLTAIWFEYGRSPSLGSATTRDPAGSGVATTLYSANLNNLAAGTLYYYRAVAQNSAGRSVGQTLSFRTQGAAPNPGTVRTPTPAPAPTVPPGATPTPAPIAGSGSAADCFSVSPSISSAQLKANDEFTYSLTYRNNCDFALSKGILELTLPPATDFAGTNHSFLTRDGNVITYDLGVIAPNFQAAVTVDGKVKPQVAEGQVLSFQANLSFADPKGLLQTTSGSLGATIVGSGTATDNGSSTLGASTADALGGLFHSGWFWLVLFLILIALFVFWLATRRRDSEDEEEEEEAGGHDHAAAH